MGRDGWMEMKIRLAAVGLWLLLPAGGVMAQTPVQPQTAQPVQIQAGQMRRGRCRRGRGHG